jgi:glycosyltransferase involved in cell wall biosynthesis
MKSIAILSSGLEKRKNRGYENSSLNLFLLLKEAGSCNVILFKGSGSSDYDQIVLDSKIKNYSELLFQKTIKPIFRNDFYGVEYFVFALYFILYSLFKQKEFDFIYSKEPRVILTLKKFRIFLPGKPKLVFGLGQMMPPSVFYDVGDIIHLVNIETYNAAITQFKETKKFHLIPNPISTIKVSKHSDKEIKEIRLKYNVHTKNVIVSIGSDSKIKRMEYVINEVAMLNESWTLIIVGNINQDVINHGHKQLKNRFISTTVPPERIGEIFSIANLSVLASTNEGFGNVVIESMMNAVPVLVHKRPLNEYILGDDRLLVNMLKTGALAQKIEGIERSNSYDELAQICRARYDSNFSGDAILQKYLHLFNCNA